MMNHHDVHVVRGGNKRGAWEVRQRGRTLSRHRTQRTAVKIGARRARRDHVDLVTHSLNGKIRSKDSFGNESIVRDTEH
jgi:hypothetical protein